MSNVFFLDITPDQREPLMQAVSSYAGVLRQPEVIATVIARLVAVNGTPV